VTFRLELPATPAAGAAVRRELVRRLGDRATAEQLGTLRLLVTELVTNAVMHAAAPPILVDVRLDRGRVRVEVHDHGAGFEKHTPKPRGAEGGYGLYLVEQMTERWGVERRGDTRVWFEMPCGKAA
jgi:anti-sigma regulatory factor (Ser/Thr protein kinase)